MRGRCTLLEARSCRQREPPSLHVRARCMPHQRALARLPPSRASPGSAGRCPGSAAGSRPASRPAHHALQERRRWRFGALLPHSNRPAAPGLLQQPRRQQHRGSGGGSGASGRPRRQQPAARLQVRVVGPHAALAALEQAGVDRVEADQGGQQAKVRLRQPLAAHKALPAAGRLGRGRWGCGDGGRSLVTMRQQVAGWECRATCAALPPCGTGWRAQMQARRRGDGGGSPANPSCN